MSHVLVVSPPFYSHAQPLTAIGRALAARGERVTFACIAEFRHLAEENNLEFYEFEGSSNRNTGLATATEQPTDDRERLLAFMRAVRQGAVQALTRQARNRQGDMLHDPEGVMSAVREMCARLRPDWCLIDHLGFSVALALYCSRTPFATLVVGHPTELQRGDDSCFGVPDRWPAEIHVDRVALPELERLAREVDRSFADAFNRIISAEDPSLPTVTSGFGFASQAARIFIYPESGWTYPRQRDRDLFIGHCTTGADVLDPRWAADLDRLTGRPRVLISFGTFQRVHTDVMRTVHQGVRQAYPDATFIISAGDRTADLADLADGRTLVRDFVPQRALLPHMDLAVHHGGINSFSESLVAGVPAIVVPFSGDQFDVAHDVARLGLGRVVDPNRLDPDAVAEAARAALGGDTATRVAVMAAQVSARGPAWAAQRLAARMRPEVHSPQ